MEEITWRRVAVRESRVTAWPTEKKPEHVDGRCTVGELIKTLEKLGKKSHVDLKDGLLVQTEKRVD